MNLKRNLKRKLAGALAFLTLFGAIPGAPVNPLGGITAEAAELYPDSSMRQNGGNSTAAYFWKGTSGASFDIAGISDPALLNSDSPYTGNGSSNIKTSYGFNGYTIAMAPGRTSPAVTNGGSSGYGFNTVNVGGNGHVKRITGGSGANAYEVELQVKLYPSEDKKWILVDYIVKNLKGEASSVLISTGVDSKIGDDDSGSTRGPADGAKLALDNNGFRMVQEDTVVSGTPHTGTYEVFELITQESPTGLALGVTQVDSRWAGQFGSRTSNYFVDFNQFASSAMDASAHGQRVDGNGFKYVHGIDSGLTYGWNVQLAPYGTTTKRVAFGAKGSSFYVSSTHGTAGATGAYDDPFQTIEQARDKIELNGGLGYILIQDYVPITNTITFKKNIMVQTADYDVNYQAITTPVTLTRGAGFTGSLFTTTGAGAIRLSDIILDGNASGAPTNDSPLLEASVGRIDLLSGTVLKNNVVTGTTKGSAINVTGTAELTIDSSEITGNTSPEGGKGAVHFDGADFTVTGEVLIKDNALSNSTTVATASNVYLPEGKSMSIGAEGINGSDIGVTTQNIPDPSDVFEVPTAAQKKIVVKHVAGSGDTGAYVGAIKADQAGVHGLIVNLADSDETALAGEVDIVFRKSGMEVVRAYIDENDLPLAPEETIYLEPGKPVSLAPKAPSTFPAPVDGSLYELKETLVTGTGLTAETDEESPDFGVVTGTMPNTAVTVTNIYQKSEARIVFETNGGTPEPADIVGKAGDPVLGNLPPDTSVTKTGYTFDGWYKNAALAPADRVTTLSGMTFAPGETILYAKWLGSSSADFIIKYVNSSESVEFDSDSTNYAVDHPVSAGERVVPGYKLEDIYVLPVLKDQIIDKNFTNDPPTGTGAVTGKMNVYDSTATYKYQVDYSSPATLTVTVRHENLADGTVLRSPDVTYFYPEDVLNLAPADIYGYEYEESTARFISGHNKDEANMITGIVDTYRDDFASDGTLDTFMPNQNVEIVYKYKPGSGTGYDFTANYVYGSENIVDPIVTQVPPLAPANHPYQSVYGYLYNGTTTKLPTTAAGSADAAGNFSGTMPNGSLTITLQHNKDPLTWDYITYKAGPNGTLDAAGRPVSPVTGSPGQFEAHVLMNNNTPAGDAGAYTWAKIQEKELLPNAVADTYYMFDQWYIDSNKNGSLDPGEEVAISDLHQFQVGPVTLIANFVEDPSKWIDINFAPGDHGTITGPTTAHLPYDKTWSDVPSWVTPMPTAIPEANYDPVDWFDGNQLMQDPMPLANGKTYTFKFAKDPDIWGLPANEPEATGMLDTDGSGKIVVHEVSEDYQYVVVDENGNIVAVKPGNSTGSLTFPDLYPGTEYEVYEVGPGETVVPGSPISSITDKGNPKDVLIPVLDNNYQVVPDTETDGKVTIIVDPADENSKYAIIDKDGNVVITEGSDSEGWKNPENGKVVFPNLDPNEEYTVVAVPKETTGVDPTDREDKGSTVVTDPGVEINVPKYIVETIRGEVAEVNGTAVGLNRYDQVEKEQLVKIEADPQDAAGNAFAYWKVIVGNVPGFPNKVTTLDYEFTMPETNVVVAAYYERRVGSPSNATVEDEVRGGSQNEMALNPNDIGDLEDLLTTPHDRELIDVNGADVTYRVVFDKNRIKRGEKEAILIDPLYDTGVEKDKAFTAPWALDIRLERYVDGRRVDRGTPSNATFDVVVQLEDESIDMLDYQLFKVVKDSNGNITSLTLVPMIDLPEENGGVGGLFHFEGEIGARYVMVYSKAYKVRFMNFNTYPESQDTTIKVRKHYPISHDDYARELGMVPDPIAVYTDNDGIEHTYLGWSERKAPARFVEYDQTKPVTKSVLLNSYYANNQEEVQEARDDLQDLLDRLLDLANEQFVTKAEKEAILDLVKEVEDLINQNNPKASLNDILNIIDRVEPQVDKYEETVAGRKDSYDDMHNTGGSSGGGGGSGSGGGRGQGTVSRPYVPEKANSYTVGVNGNWVAMDDSGMNWSFTLNGGIPLTSMWAWLEYTDANVNLTGWYHFNSRGLMDYGWFLDEANNWYYCDTVHDGHFGLMKTGWHFDSSDQHWYYLEASGIMAKGWREIGGVWYYFTPQNDQATWSYDPVTEKWSFMQVSARPLGSMYASESTPDGYQVDANGAWIR